jgi:hypothetical protein
MFLLFSVPRAFVLAGVGANVVAICQHHKRTSRTAFVVIPLPALNESAALAIPECRQT